ncbi:MAG: M28 family peptidase [Gemmatimonadota bacterium]
MTRSSISVRLVAGAGACLLAGCAPTRTATAGGPIASPFASIATPVARELSGARALSTVAYVEQFFRLPGNRGFDASIDTVARLLDRAGFVEESRARPADRLTYRIESRPMSSLAWSPIGGEVTLSGSATPLLRWATNHNMLAINSWSTPAGGVDADVVDVGTGTDADFDRASVSGKIVTGTVTARTLYSRAMQRGALGVFAPQKLASYKKPDVNRTAIEFSAVGLDTVHHGFAIFLSTAANATLRQALASGPVRAHVVVNTLLEKRPERTLVAEVRGNSRPQERFVYSAHVQEPGANDNASGVGLLAEMARTAAVMLKAGKTDPARTVTFLWGDEIRSTQRYLAEDSVRRAGVKWGMSLDMVGENTALTGGTFLIEKMKDPAAVWVRGDEQHTEWGGSPVKASDIWAYWLNDFVKQRCLDRAATNGWVVKANPFEGGSDHTPFLNAKIPAVLMWHFTDQYYHTDRDRIEMVSPTTLANVGNCALTTGLLLAGGTASTTQAALAEFVQVAVRRIETEAALSRQALTAASGPAALARETLTLETWRDYYIAALAKIPEIAAVPVDLGAAIEAGQARIRAAGDDAIRLLR